ncbi:MAG: DNA primase, partial [Calditrichaeota bacterium]
MEIAEIKQSLSILKVLAHYNLILDRHSRLICPFHEDKSPSLKIYASTNTFYCFSCGVSGDTIEFIQLKEKCSKHEAIEKAKSLSDPLYTITTKPMKQIEEKNLLPRLAVLSKVAQDSKASFKRVDKEQKYLKSRGFDPDKMETGYISMDFGKGWNPQLQESGLQFGILRESRQGTIVPKFKNCLLFFTKNEKGQIIDLYGRSITDNGTARHYYLNGHHQGIYPKYPETTTKKLILTEAIIDCETLLQQEELSGQFGIISLFGTNGLTAEIQQAIRELPELDEVILFFDGDDAGDKAITKHAETLRHLKPSVKITRVETPKDEDINSLLLGHDPEILQHLVKLRKPVTGSEDENQAVEIGVPPDPILDTTNPDKITYHEGELLFTIWGGVEKDNIHRLKINLLVQLASDSFKYYQDDVNLYSNGQLQRYIRGATEELECSTTVLKTTLRKLQTMLEEYRLKLVEAERKALKPKTYQMTREEENQAMNFLRSKHLVKNTLKAIERCGLVGEQKNGLLLFFLYLSRLMDEPLHAI